MSESPRTPRIRSAVVATFVTPRGIRAMSVDLSPNSTLCTAPTSGNTSVTPSTVSTPTVSVTPSPLFTVPTTPRRVTALDKPAGLDIGALTAELRKITRSLKEASVDY
jgi:cell division septation protein DedD